MNKLLLTVAFFIIGLGANAFYFSSSSVINNVDEILSGNNTKPQVSFDTATAVEVTIKNINAWLPNFRLEHYPFLMDAFKYGDMFSESDVQYMSHNIREADFPSSLKNEVASRAVKKYLIATFENKWDKLALLWIPKKAAHLSANPTLDITDDRGVFMVIQQNSIEYDTATWKIRQVSFDDGFEAVTNPSEPAKVADILSDKTPRPSLFGSFFFYMYGWLNNGFKDVNGGSDAEGTDDSIRNYLQVYVPDASGPNYVYKRKDGSYFSEMIFTHGTGTANPISIGTIINKLVPQTDDVFIYVSNNEEGKVYYLLHEDANKDMLYFGQIYSPAAQQSNDTVFSHFELFPKDEYKVDNYRRAYVYIIKADLAKNHNQYNKSFFWLQKAAALNDPMAMYRIGYAFYNGEGTPVDLEKAKYWLELSAAAGNKSAKEYLVKTGLKK